MENVYTTLLGFVEIAETIYKDELGINLGKVCYCFHNDNNCFVYTRAELRQNPSLQKMVLNEANEEEFFFLNGARINPIFAEDSSFVFIPNSNLTRYTFVHEEYMALNEGVASKMEESKIFSGNYLQEDFNEISTRRSFFENSFEGSVDKWRTGKISFSTDLCHHVIGYFFVSQVLKEEKNLRSFVNLLRDNLPTEEEFLKPEKYLEKTSKYEAL